MILACKVGAGWGLKGNLAEKLARNLAGDRGHKTKRINEREPENGGRT